jgi:hypothetical protein
MTSPHRYPFSDLTADQMRDLMRAASRERNLVVWNLFSKAFRGEWIGPIWPRRQREAQVWTPKNVHALSLDAHC